MDYQNTGGISDRPSQEEGMSRQSFGPPQLSHQHHQQQQMMSTGQIRSPLRMRESGGLSSRQQVPLSSNRGEVNMTRPSARGSQMPPQSSAIRMSSAPDMAEEEGNVGQADDEEAKYERRRQEAVRMTPNSQLSNVQVQQLQPQIRPQSANQGTNSSSGQSRLQPIVNQTAPFSLGPQPSIPTFQNSQLPQIRPLNLPQNTPLHIREHISHLHQDNAGLLRRLNTVYQELQRLSREKSQLQHHLTKSMQETQVAYDALQSEDNLDKVNKYMKDDLVYERDRNSKLAKQVEEARRNIARIGDDLKRIENDQDSLMRDNQESQYILQKTISEGEDLEREQVYNNERIRDSMLSIDQTSVSCNHLHQEIQLLRQNIEALIIERNDIILRLNETSHQYEVMVHQLAEDRRGLQIMSAEHSKIATACLLFNQLSLIHKRRLQFGFQEINTYTQFDNKCNLKLKFLAKLMERTGRQKLKVAMTRWFSSALKPIEVMDQSKLVSLYTGRLIRVQTFYRAWRNLYLDKIKSYDQKTQSIHIIWAKLTEEAKIEKQRAIRIWKESFNRFKLQKYRLKRIMWKQFFKSASCAFNAWQNYRSFFDSQVRLNLLAVDYSYQQQLAILFHNFHMRTQDKKRRRHSKLQICLLEWKNYLNHQKYLMSQNLIASNFKIETFTSTIKGCFDALKFYKQRKLLSKTDQALTNEQDTKTDLNLIIRDLLDSRQITNTYRACNAVKTALEKRLWSYIEKWRKVNLEYQENVRTTLKGLSIKVYMQFMRIAFKRWRLKHSQTVDGDHQDYISNLQSEHRNLQNDLISLSNANRDKNDELSQKRVRHLNKCVNAFEKRFKSISVGRWRDKVTSFQEKEHGAFLIMRRLRLRLCRKVFNFYMDGVNLMKKGEMHENRAQLYIKTRNSRLSMQVLNSWLLFKKNHQRAKSCWYRIFLRLDMSQKRQIIKKWRENTQNVTEDSLEIQKQNCIDTIDDLNHQIGQLHCEETEQQKLLACKNHLLKTQGQRILSNAFARFYYINQCRGLEKWKDFTQFEKRKEQLLRKSISHIQKSQFYFVKACFKNWIQNTKVLERELELKKECIKAQDTLFQAKLSSDQNTDLEQQLNSAIEEEEVESNILKSKHSNVVLAIKNRVLENHYMNRKQYIFQQWSKYVKREVFFITCIKNVMLKSLFDQGFQAIKQAARHSHKSDVKNTVLSKFYQSFQKRVLINAISNWRASDFRSVTLIINDTRNEHKLRGEKHENRMDHIKSHNAKRAEGLITDFLKRNVIKAWRNVCAYQRLQRQQRGLLLQELTSQQQRQALIKWRSRVQATQQRKTSFLRAKTLSKLLRTRMVFNEMKKRYFLQKEVLKRLSNLATTVDHCRIQMSFHAIASFAKAKYFAYSKRKENATTWLAVGLGNIFKMKKRQYLTEFRAGTIDKWRVDSLQKVVIGLNNAQKMRSYFIQWKEQSEKKTLIKELNEEGPVREQDFNYRSELRNIKDLMKEEGYDGEDLDGALKSHKTHQNNLLLKAIRRMQHYNEDLYVKPKLFDRWKEFVHMRKLYRYWLSFVEKRAQLVRSDLHFAFDKWKRFHPIKKQQLTVKSKQDLNKRAIKNNKVLDQLAEEINDKESMLDHLNAQRETLLDNYIKSQKLGLTSCDSQIKHSMHRKFSQWVDFYQNERNSELKSHLHTNLAHLEALKERIKLIEAQNESLGAENEELRQFSLDGYDIAKNVQLLTAEREVLSVDLADKAQVIRKLLDENEMLTIKLERAQKHAETLIKMTMRRGGGDRPQSGSQTFARNSYR